MHNYKVYVFDRKVSQQYPVTVRKKNVNELCKWINSLVSMYGIEVVSGHLLDKYGAFIDEIEFLPTEIVNQYFITNYAERLIAFNEFMNGI